MPVVMMIETNSRVPPLLRIINSRTFTILSRSNVHIFTALHVMQMRYSDENSVRPSVRPSVTRVNCDKTEERSVQIFIPYER